MSGGWLAAAEAAAEAWAGAMTRACWQGGLAVAGAWLLARLAPRIPPRIRCWLWRLAYLKFLIALLWATPVEVPLLPLETAPAPRWGGPLAATVAVGAGLPADVPGTSGEPVPRHPSWTLGLFGVWLAGVGWSWLRVARGWRAAQRCRRAGAGPDSGAGVEPILRDLAGRLGLRRLPRVLVSARPGTPMLIGVIRPAVVLPASLLSGSGPGPLRLVLAHELAHLRRLDLAWNWLPALVRGPFFFHPLIWLAGREWQADQESACDELALEVTGAGPADYGRALLRAARRTASPALGPAAAGVSESYVVLKRRLNSMRHFAPLSRRRLRLAYLALLLAGTSLIVPWRLTAARAHAQDPEPAAPPPMLSLAPPGFFGPPLGLDQIANESTVRKELKLSEDQDRRLREVLRRQRQAQDALAEQARARTGDPAAMQLAHAEIATTTERAILRLLEPGQKARMEQIRLQLEGPKALLRPEVQRKLNMDPDQIEAVVALVARGSGELMRAATVPLPDGVTARDLVENNAKSDRLNTEEFQDKRREARAAASKVGQRLMRDAVGVLRKSQAATYRKMLGEPYDVTNMGGLPFTNPRGETEPSGSRKPAAAPGDGGSSDRAAK
jgi:hypothetical protein